MTIRIMFDFHKSSINGALRKVLKRFHYPLEVMLTCMRWYVAYPLNLRHIEEMTQERGVFVDHATVHRWTIKIVAGAGSRFSAAQAGEWMRRSPSISTGSGNGLSTGLAGEDDA